MYLGVTALSAAAFNQVERLFDLAVDNLEYLSIPGTCVERV